MQQVREKSPTTKAESSELTVRFARNDDAEAISRLYERVFGPCGIKADGHQAYPAPDMFSAAGVRRAIQDSHRNLITAELDGVICGGMVIHLLSEYHCEFACVCVDPDFRGLGLSFKILQFARDLARKSLLTINSTEIVTHSVNSQAAHARVGYGNITGFAFCQYPRVFFKNHEESVAWISQIDGVVAEALRKSRENGSTDTQLETREEEALYKHLNKTRLVFVPDTYREVCTGILEQFKDILDYRISENDTECSTTGKSCDDDVYIDIQEGEPFSYIYCMDGLGSDWQTRLTELIERGQSFDGKHFIQARINANSPAAVRYSQYLREKGFSFMGFLPIYKLSQEPEPVFNDLLILQWIHPEVLNRNSLPGGTDAVAKLYGHPANLNGEITRIQRKEMY